MRIFISQPMHGKTREAIEAERAPIIALLEQAGHEVVHTIFDYKILDEEVRSPALWFLSKALRELAKCDAAIFFPGWEKARGCKIERECCKMYGIDILPLDCMNGSVAERINAPVLKTGEG